MALSLAFGLLGMAPAGLIMALTAVAMAPHRRAFGMGIFFSAYFLLMAPARRWPAGSTTGRAIHSCRCCRPLPCSA